MTLVQHRSCLTHLMRFGCLATEKQRKPAGFEKLSFTRSMKHASDSSCAASCISHTPNLPGGIIQVFRDLNLVPRPACFASMHLSPNCSPTKPCLSHPACFRVQHCCECVCLNLSVPSLDLLQPAFLSGLTACVYTATWNNTPSFFSSGLPPSLFMKACYLSQVSLLG